MREAFMRLQMETGCSQNVPWQKEELSHSMPQLRRDFYLLARNDSKESTESGWVLASAQPLQTFLGRVGQSALFAPSIWTRSGLIASRCRSRCGKAMLMPAELNLSLIASFRALMVG